MTSADGIAKGQHPWCQASPDTLPQTESSVPLRESYFQQAAAAAALRSNREAPSMPPGLVHDQKGTLASRAVACHLAGAKGESSSTSQ